MNYTSKYAYLNDEIRELKFEGNSSTTIAKTLIKKYDLDCNTNALRFYIYTLLGADYDKEIVLENVKLAKQKQLAVDKNRIANKSFREDARIENAVAEYNNELVKLIKIADKTVSLSLNRGKHVITELLISDNQYDSTFYLSDMLMIDPVPNIELPPSVSAVIEIDDEFMNKFITARKALNEATIFNVETQGDSVLFVLGDKNTLSHKVKISLSATITDEIPSIMSLPFNIDYLHEIFSANYGSKGTINIYSQGLLEINFVDEKTKGEATYFLVRLQER
jgi:hypothetical protein